MRRPPIPRLEATNGKSGIENVDVPIPFLAQISSRTASVRQPFTDRR